MLNVSKNKTAKVILAILFIVGAGGIKAYAGSMNMMGMIGAHNHLLQANTASASLEEACKMDKTTKNRICQNATIVSMAYPCIVNFQKDNFQFSGFLSSAIDATDPMFCSILAAAYGAKASIDVIIEKPSDINESLHESSKPYGHISHDTVIRFPNDDDAYQKLLPAWTSWDK